MWFSPLGQLIIDYGQGMNEQEDMENTMCGRDQHVISFAVQDGQQIRRIMSLSRRQLRLFPALVLLIPSL